MLSLNWPSGIVNIVDNYPATSKEWLPIYAAAIGAHKPKVQDGKNSWERGASNNKARKEYGWTPLFPSWSEGFNNLIGSRNIPLMGMIVKYTIKGLGYYEYNLGKYYINFY